MDSNKKNKCEICGWQGKTHLHHIIPRSRQGSEDNENIIELCPNHHSEATSKEYDFAKRFKLVGKLKSNEELEAIKDFSFLLFNGCKTKEDAKKLLLIESKFNFDRFDALAYFMGITRRQAEKYALCSFNDKQIKQVE